MFGHATLQARVAATVFAGAEAGITGNLAPIIEPAPIANLPIDHYAGQFAQAARWLSSGGTLQLERELVDRDEITSACLPRHPAVAYLFLVGRNRHALKYDQSKTRGRHDP
jgi:hypothetical protein